MIEDQINYVSTKWVFFKQQEPLVLLERQGRRVSYVCIRTFVRQMFVIVAEREQRGGPEKKGGTTVWDCYRWRSRGRRRNLEGDWQPQRQDLVRGCNKPKND